MKWQRETRNNVSFQFVTIQQDVEAKEKATMQCNPVRLIALSVSVAYQKGVKWNNNYKIKMKNKK